MKSAVVLVVVIGVMLVVFVLSLIALSIMTQQSRIAEHKIKRTRGYFAAQAGMVHALEVLRNGGDPDSTSVAIGVGIPGYPAGGLAADIDVEAVGVGTGPGGTRQVDITVDYR